VAVGRRTVESDLAELRRRHHHRMKKPAGGGAEA
jgi:hypothetical protein